MGGDCHKPYLPPVEPGSPEAVQPLQAGRDPLPQSLGQTLSPPQHQALPFLILPLGLASIFILSGYLGDPDPQRACHRWPADPSLLSLRLRDCPLRSSPHTKHHGIWLSHLSPAPLHFLCASALFSNLSHPASIFPTLSWGPSPSLPCPGQLWKSPLKTQQENGPSRQPHTDTHLQVPTTPHVPLGTMPSWSLLVPVPSSVTSLCPCQTQILGS